MLNSNGGFFNSSSHYEWRQRNVQICIFTNKTVAVQVQYYTFDWTTSELLRSNLHVHHVWFQIDHYPGHTLDVIRNYLNRIYPDKLIEVSSPQVIV